jgi:hypothetical protein
MINDCGYWFADEVKWQVVADSGVSWRASPDFNDKMAGKGPGPGEKFRATRAVQKGDGPDGTDCAGNDLEYWFIKTAVVPGQLAFLPVNSQAGQPLLRPTFNVPSYSEEQMWEVTYDGGVAIRKSTLYNDKDIGDDGTPAVVFEEGTVFQGMALPGTTREGATAAEGGDEDLPEMILITDRLSPNGKPYIMFVPLVTQSGDPVCRKRKDLALNRTEALDEAHGKMDPDAISEKVWTEHQSGGRSYWHNNATGETTWNDPFAPPPPPAAPEPPAPELPTWEQLSSGGKPYWHNRRTGETTWEDPNAPAPPPAPPAPPPQRRERRPPPPEDDEEDDEYSEDEDEECFPGVTDWEDLSRNQRKAAKKLGYKPRSWNNDDNDDLEGVEWSDLSKGQKKAATMLGYNRKQWNADFGPDSEDEEEEREPPRRSRRGGGGGGSSRGGRGPPHGGSTYSRGGGSSRGGGGGGTYTRGGGGGRGSSGPLDGRTMHEFKEALEGEYLQGRGPMVGEFFDRFGGRLSGSQMAWCERKEEECRRNPRAVYNM